MSDYRTNTYYSRPKCHHLNGWTITATFWIFKKRYFVCTDCGHAIKKG